MSDQNLFSKKSQCILVTFLRDRFLLNRNQWLSWMAYTHRFHSSRGYINNNCSNSNSSSRSNSNRCSSNSTNYICNKEPRTTRKLNQCMDRMRLWKTCLVRLSKCSKGSKPFRNIKWTRTMEIIWMTSGILAHLEGMVEVILCTMVWIQRLLLIIQALKLFRRRSRIFGRSHICRITDRRAVNHIGNLISIMNRTVLRLFKIFEHEEEGQTGKQAGGW